MEELRREDLVGLWEDETDEEWREDLPTEERDFLADLDKQYRRGLLRMCEDTLILDLIPAAASTTRTVAAILTMRFFIPLTPCRWGTAPRSSF